MSSKWTALTWNIGSSSDYKQLDESRYDLSDDEVRAARTDMLQKICGAFDVVCLQEAYTFDWPLLEGAVVPGFYITHDDSNGSSRRNTAIAWNPEKFETIHKTRLEHEGVHAAVAILKHIVSGIAVIFLSVHIAGFNMAYSQDMMDEQAQFGNEQLQHYIDELDRLKLTYPGAHVMIAGDLNADTPYYKKRHEMLNTSGYITVKNTEPTFFDQNLKKWVTLDWFGLDFQEFLPRTIDFTHADILEMSVQENPSDHKPVGLVLEVSAPIPWLARLIPWLFSWMNYPITFFKHAK